MKYSIGFKFTQRELSTNDSKYSFKNDCTVQEKIIEYEITGGFRVADYLDNETYEKVNESVLYTIRPTDTSLCYSTTLFESELDKIIIENRIRKINDVA